MYNLYTITFNQLFENNLHKLFNHQHIINLKFEKIFYQIMNKLSQTILTNVLNRILKSKKPISQTMNHKCSY